MCGGPEHLKPSSSSSSQTDNSANDPMNEDSFSNLLELAANNDVDGFNKSVEDDPSAVDEISLWYGRKKGSNQMVLEPRTPLMVAATYGSLDILRLILALSSCDVNRSCGPDKTTALHCAASGGSEHAVDAVKMLISAGADPNCVDAGGFRPADVIVVSPNLYDVKIGLEELLGSKAVALDRHRGLRVSTNTSSSNSPPLSSSPDEDGDGSSPSSDSTSSPTARRDVSEKKEYPIDPSLPDIKNSIYATDEFRMFSFKVRPCSRAYSHDWTECPFVHPGENARRRDPRKYHYSCVPCPDFRKGSCRRGDLCEYAHGVFECWLHPAQYRTRMCKDGTACARRVCFFAHTPDELRPLYMSTGSAVPSPRSSASAMEMAAAAMSLLPGSPSSVSVMSPNPFTPPMSPSGNGMGHSSLGWQQPNVPTLHLPGSNNLQSSRLRSSLSARDMPMDDLPMLSDFEAQQLNDFYFSTGQARLGSLVGNRSVQSKALNPSNLDELFSAEISSSPRYNSDQGAVFSPSHKSALLNQFQQQQQSLLSPIKTNSVFSPLTVDSQQISGHNSLLQASLGISSPGRMSPRSMEQHSPLSTRLSQFAQQEKLQQLRSLSAQEKLQQLRSLSSRDLGSSAAASMGSPVNSRSKWGSPSGKLDWGVNGEELGRLKRSSSFDLGSGGEEPDVSWVQSLVSPPEAKEKQGSSNGGTMGDGPNANVQMEDHAVLGAWLEQMQLDSRRVA